MAIYFLSTNTTCVGSSPAPTDASTTLGLRPPRLVISLAALSSSACAERPFKATSRPCGLSSGNVQPASLVIGATARQVTTAKGWGPCPLRIAAMTSSERSRMMVTFSSPISSTHSCSHSTRRSIGSIKVKRWSGKHAAATSPGKPPPEPISATVLNFAPSVASRTKGTIAAELRICRSQMMSITRPNQSARLTLPGKFHVKHFQLRQRLPQHFPQHRSPIQLIHHLVPAPFLSLFALAKPYVQSEASPHQLIYNEYVSYGTNERGVDEILS